MTQRRSLLRPFALFVLLATLAVSAAAQPDFSTFFGGRLGEQGTAVAVDAEGFVYLAGITRGLPATAGAVDDARGDFEVFILKTNPAGTEVVWTAVFGGSAQERATGVAVDSAGAVYVTGITFSTDFPTTPGSVRPAYGGGGRDGFVAKLAPDGSALEYAAYLGGGAFDDAFAIAVDAQGRAFVAGATGSADFPGAAAAPAAQAAFVARLSADGAALEAVRLLDGSGRDEARGLALAPGDAGVWLVGSTSSPDFPVPEGGFRSALAGVDDAFAVRLDAGLEEILSGTLLGGRACVQPFGGTPCEIALGVAADASGAVVAGSTVSPDLPTTRGVPQPSFGGGSALGDAFVARLGPDAGLQWLTYLGGATDDQAVAVALDRRGAALVVGGTGSADFPVAPGAPLGSLQGKDDAFYARLSADGAELLDASFWGGADSDRALAATSDGEAVVFAGVTSSPGFPVTPDALQTAYAGVNAEAGDAFVARRGLVFRPRIAAGGVLHAATLEGGPVSAGEIVSVFGDRIGPAEPAGLEVRNGRVTTDLAGVRLRVNGVPAPLLFVSETQLNAVVPANLGALNVAAFQVERDGLRSGSSSALVAPAVPGLFTLTANGAGQAAALNQDGTVNGAGAPAARGSVIVLFGTGAGRMRPASPDGAVIAGEDLPRPTSPAEVTIGGAPAEVLYAGAAPGLVSGVLQVNARIPDGAAPGPLPVVLTITGRSSPPSATVVIGE